jgi:integrase
MLTDVKIRTAKPGDKEKKLYDELGLFLLIKPSGSKLWRFRYQFASKAKLLAIGAYPDVTLQQARKSRSELREQLLQGIDPAEVRKKRKEEPAPAIDTFGEIGREWMAVKGDGWSDSHRERNERLIFKDLAPLCERPIREISVRELLSVLRVIEDRGAVDTAHRARQAAGMVFRFGVVTDRAERDISQDLKNALKPHKKTHYAAPTEPDELRKLLVAIDHYHGNYSVCAALRLAPLVFIRPGLLAAMEWSDIDWQKDEWRIAGKKMKSDRDHVVPLSSHSIAILKEQQLRTGNLRYVFPSVRSRLRPLSDGALRVALRTMGFDKSAITPHGFRATARTILEEKLGFRADFIEHQLAHLVKDPNRRAYNRTSFLAERKEMMQKWADYLDELKSPA